MAVPVIQLDNQTASPIVLVQLGITVPASSSIVITGQDGILYVFEVLDDRELHEQVSSGYITLTVNTVTLTQEQSLAYLNPHNDLEGIKHKLNATTAPTVNDDSSAGYAPGSLWLDTVENVSYSCFDASSGAAVWARLVTAYGNVTGIFFWGNENVATGTDIRYMHPGFGDQTALLTRISVRMPRSGSLMNMYVHHNGLGASSNRVRYTLQVNAVSSALVIDLQANAPDASDTTTVVPVAAGDLVDIEITKPDGSLGGGGSPTEITITLELA